jgi:hypothetical protein
MLSNNVSSLADDFTTGIASFCDETESLRCSAGERMKMTMYGSDHLPGLMTGASAGSERKKEARLCMPTGINQ